MGLIPKEFSGVLQLLRINTAYYFPQSCAEYAENPQRSLRDEKLFVQLNSFKQTTSITNYLFHLIPQEFLRIFCVFCATLREIFNDLLLEELHRSRSFSADRIYLTASVSFPSLNIREMLKLSLYPPLPHESKVFTR